MRKSIVMTVMLAMMLALAAPVSAQTATSGDLIAGQISDEVVVAGNFLPPEQFTGPDNLPLGTDIALSGNPIPPNPFAASLNVSFDFDLAVAGAGPIEDDVIAGSNFIGTDFIEAGSGENTIEIENGFLQQ